LLQKRFLKTDQDGKKENPKKINSGERPPTAIHSFCKEEFLERKTKQ